MPAGNQALVFAPDRRVAFAAARLQRGAIENHNVPVRVYRLVPPGVYRKVAS